MALPEYFERNAQAAAALVQGFDSSRFAAMLQEQVIGVGIDASVEAAAEGRSTADLTVRLLARLYPTLAICGIGHVNQTYLQSLRDLAMAINPRIELQNRLTNATKVLAIGQTRLLGRTCAGRHVWYVGSNNWIAQLSKARPVGSLNSDNPLGAGAAACVAAANVFRAIFTRELGDATLDSELSFSLLNMRPQSNQANPVLTRVVLDDVHLVGAGAIGNGALWAFGRMPCRGNLHIVDAETVTDSNLQRYVMVELAHREREKALIAAEWVKRAGFTVTPHVATWATHIASIPDYKVKTVLSAVDTAEVRIQIQASLPQSIFNGWTQKGEAGVSRHNFLGSMACLACLYMPKPGVKNEDVLVTQALNLEVDAATVKEVRRRLQKNEPTERLFLERIATASNVDIERLASFEGRSLREFYVEAVCGGRVMEFHGAALQVRAEVPMGFQSALSGILLAAELARPTPLPHTVTQIDLLGTFPEIPGRAQAKTRSPLCFCLDEDFIAVYREKYVRAKKGEKMATDNM